MKIMFGFNQNCNAKFSKASNTSLNKAQNFKATVPLGARFINDNHKSAFELDNKFREHIVNDILRIKEIVDKKSNYNVLDIFKLIKKAKKKDINPENIQNIVGKNELKYLIDNRIIADDYKVGNDLKVNLHAHTDDCHGKKTTVEFLEEAKKQAITANEKFLFAITNHDTTLGSKKAILNIMQNPDEYKDVLFITGIEFNARYNNQQYLKTPMSVEVVGLALNPFNKEFDEYLTGYHNNSNNHAGRFLNKANRRGLELSTDELYKSNPDARNGGPGQMWAIESYIAKSAAEKLYNNDVAQGKAFAKEVLDLHYKDVKEDDLTPYTPNFDTLAHVTKSANGMLSLAHPLRIMVDKRLNEYGAKNPIQTYTEMVKDFIKSGGSALESNYQAMRQRESDKGKKGLIELDVIKNLINEHLSSHVRATGGLDSHNSLLDIN